MDHTSIAVLNELLAAEQAGLAPRLLESTVYISRRDVQAHTLLLRLANSSRRRSAALADLIQTLGGTPQPGTPDVATADLHFQELNRVLPRLIAEQQRLTELYARAAHRLSKYPPAAVFLNPILNDCQRDLETLTAVPV